MKKFFKLEQGMSKIMFLPPKKLCKINEIRESIADSQFRIQLWQAFDFGFTLSKEITQKERINIFQKWYKNEFHKIWP